LKTVEGRGRERETVAGMGGKIEEIIRVEKVLWD
jgi:hypothetical protein